MITKFIKRILRRDPMVRPTHANNSGAPKRIPKKTHRIDPHLLSKNAVKVTHTLQQAGYEAFIVGGAVRDLVLGIGPKDFDVASTSTPSILIFMCVVFYFIISPQAQNHLGNLALLLLRPGQHRL